MAKRREERPWEERLRNLPPDASLRAKVEAVVYCGGASGEHPRGQTYYCCEKVDVLLALSPAPDADAPVGRARSLADFLANLEHRAVTLPDQRIRWEQVAAILRNELEERPIRGSWRPPGGPVEEGADE